MLDDEAVCRREGTTEFLGLYGALKRQPGPKNHHGARHDQRHHCSTLAGSKSHEAPVMNECIAGCARRGSQTTFTVVSIDRG